MPGDRLRSAARNVRPRRGGRRELSGLQARRHRRVAAAARLEGRARTQRGFVVVGDPDMSIEEAARRRDFTDQRHLVGSADRRVLRSVRRPRRPRAAPAADGRRPRRFPTTASACCARSSSSRASISTLDLETRALCRTIPLDDLPAERIWGEIEKLLLRAAAIDRLRAGHGPRRHRRAVSRAAGARRLSTGAGVASRRRRLGAHAPGDRSRAHAHRRSAAPAAAGRHARRGLPRSRQAGDDGVHRRTDPIDGSRGTAAWRRRRRCSIA